MRHLLFCFTALSLWAFGPPVIAGGYEGKRVLHIDSYHLGNEWNDRIADAVRATLEGTGVELHIIHLDAKRRSLEEEKRAAALQAKEMIETFRPDVVTASDDDAAKYLIMPYYRDAELPFVFCGLNWDASVYGLPYSNVTGMVEVSPIPQIIRLLRGYARGDRIGYLTENTETKRKELEYHEKLFGIRYDKVYLVRTFEEWKEAFLRAQDEVDLLVTLGVAAVTGWDDDGARALAENYTKIPAGTDFAWLMHFNLLAVGKVPEEQGRWAARAALKILDGVQPSRIPLTYNKEGQLYFNTKIAVRLGIKAAPPLAQLVP
jgi:LmbE family N-acetylglucosaminyl deacetylase